MQSKYTWCEKIKKITVFVCFLLLFVNVSYGAELFYENEDDLIWADILSGAAYYNAAGANITLTYPNTTTFISNQPMTQQNIGLFYYNFTPDVTGQWYASVTFYNSTQTIALATSTISVVEVERGIEEMALTVLIGLMAMVGILIYYGTGFFKMNAVGYKMFGLMINSIASFLVIVIAYVLLEISVGSTYEGLMSLVFRLTWIFITIGNTVAYILIMIVGVYEPAKIAGQVADKFDRNI